MILPANKIKHKEFNCDVFSNRIFKSFGFVSDAIDVFVYASLSSKKVKDLELLLDLGLKKIREFFVLDNNEKILDRMKNAIFTSGDFLANYLVSEHYPVDDVDYSVAILCFYKDVLYVWIDGDFNALIYRNNKYLLLNDEFKNQFFGSGYLEPNDFILLSTNTFFEQKIDYSDLFKHFVFNNFNYNYPAVIIGYKLDKRLDDSAIKESTSNFVLQGHHIPNQSIHYFNNIDGVKKFINYFNLFFHDNLKQKVSQYRLRNKLQFLISILQTYLSKLWNFYFRITSTLLDKIFVLLYGRNSLKYKRIKAGNIKKTLQYLILFVFIIIISSVMYYLLKDNTQVPAVSNNNDSIDNYLYWDAIKLDLNSQLSQINNFVKNKDFEKFENLKLEILNKIKSLKNTKNVDIEYLYFLENELVKNEDMLYSNYPIQKVDEIYTFDNLGNVEIVDFSVSNGVLYALDRLNSRILVSNRVNQNFEIFLTDTDFKALIQIVCNKKDECYILDEEKGLAILNLKTKKINKYSGLQNVGKGVKELALFNVGDLEYIYTLKPLESKVVRYMRIGAGISEGETWNLDNGFGPNTTDFYIDGSIYELSSNGELRRFYARRLDKNSFAGIANIPLNMGGNLQFVATPPRDPGLGVINRAYISDPQNERIVVLNRDLNSDKKMTFLGSLKYRGPSPNIRFNSISEIILSDDEKYLYCLSGNVIFKIIVTDLF